MTRDYKDSDTLLVTEVDCTSDTGKGLCSELTLLLASLLASETLVPISRKRGVQLQLLLDTSSGQRHYRYNAGPRRAAIVDSQWDSALQLVIILAATIEFSR